MGDFFAINFWALLFQVRGLQQLSAGHRELRLPSSAHEEFTLVLNTQYQGDFTGCYPMETLIYEQKRVYPR